MTVHRSNACVTQRCLNMACMIQGCVLSWPLPSRLIPQILLNIKVCITNNSCQRLMPGECCLNTARHRGSYKYLLFIHDCFQKHVLSLLRHWYAHLFQRKWLNLSFQKGRLIPVLKTGVKLIQKPHTIWSLYLWELQRSDRSTRLASGLKAAGKK